ncbi:hypothetical protein CJP74_03940 [Psittacicella melopsittaci]|uniref:Major facilitator superfamily (MFS) profile domain-containing protein n=1 Tax=Psittacicella melopsittaci TaxID=2028576 RepID=A0A3A1Y340_9GAMM|nr:MFS transporter [Psittacicella melopsittaci]RIY32643.1 hypothetical protein CJP74_03940 [Psittacicella melopsittaci]
MKLYRFKQHTLNKQHQDTTLDQQPIGQASPTYGGVDYVSPHQIQLQKKLGSKIILLLILGIIAVSAPVSNDALIPAIVTLKDFFAVSVEQIQAVIPYFVIGLGIGQVIWGPVIDRFGRKSVLSGLIVAAIVSNFIIVSVTSYEAFLGMRIVQGIIYVGLGVIPSVVLKDIYSPREFIVYNAYLTTLFMFGPALAPLIGSLMLKFIPWQGIYHVISVLLLVAFLAFLRSVPETIDPEKKQPFHTVRILRNYLSILKNPPSVALIIAITALEIAGIAIPTLLPAVLIVDYNIDPTTSSILLGVSIAFLIAGMIVNQQLVRKQVAINTVWKVFSLLLIVSVAFNVFLISTGLISHHLLVISLAINGFFFGALNGTMHSVYLMRYEHITGTALALLLSTMLILSGIILAPITQLPRLGGLTLVALIGVAALTAGIINLVYQKVWGIDEDKASQAAH